MRSYRWGFLLLLAVQSGLSSAEHVHAHVHAHVLLDVQSCCLSFCTTKQLQQLGPPVRSVVWQAERLPWLLS